MPKICFCFVLLSHKKFTPFCQSITESICSLTQSAINRANTNLASAINYLTSEFRPGVGNSFGFAGPIRDMLSGQYINY